MKNKTNLENEVISLLGEIRYNYKLAPKIKIIDNVKGAYILISEIHIQKINNIIKELTKL